MFQCLHCIYALIGLFSGIAYLAKGSVQPLLLVFIGVSSLRCFWGWILAHWPGKTGTSLWIRRNHWFGLALLLFVHLMTCGPRPSPPPLRNLATPRLQKLVHPHFNNGGKVLARPLEHEAYRAHIA